MKLKYLVILLLIGTVVYGAEFPAFMKTTEKNMVLTDTTTVNSDTTKHGFLKKLSGDTTQYMRGDGNWATVPGSVAATVADTTITFVDTTTGNADTTKHGFLIKLDGDTTKYLRSDGSWNVPPSGSGSDTAAVWGAITGTLSDQTDLQDSLNVKSDTSHLHSYYQSTLTFTGGLSETNDTVTIQDYNTTNWDSAYSRMTYYDTAYSTTAHVHDSTTISNLVVQDFESQNISQWTNDAGYLTTAAGSGITSLNGLTGTAQVFSLTDTGTTVSIGSTGTTHIFDFPFSSTGINGFLDSTNWQHFDSAWRYATTDHGFLTTATDTAAIWGGITGTLSNQTDLQNELNDKLDTSQNFSGDVTGTFNATVVGNNSHTHDSTTISDLQVADFTSPNISNWTNDSGYITTTEVYNSLALKSDTSHLHAIYFETLSAQFDFESPTTTDTWIKWKVPFNITVVECHLITHGAGANITAQFERYNSTSTTFIATLDSTDLSSTTYVEASDTNIQFPYCSTGEYIKPNIKTKTGSPEAMNMGFKYIRTQ